MYAGGDVVLIQRKRAYIERTSHSVASVCGIESPVSTFLIDSLCSMVLLCPAQQLLTELLNGVKRTSGISAAAVTFVSAGDVFRKNC